MTLFDRELGLLDCELEVSLRGIGDAPDADFILNPRRLRGSDFLMRWSQGRWSEERLIEAVNEDTEFFALAYGPSGVAPRDPREMEIYFDRLDAAGLGESKRPDLLILPDASRSEVSSLVDAVGGPAQLPFLPEGDNRIQRILRRAVLAVECENSLWRAASMPHYGRPLRPMRRLAGGLGLPKNAVVPTVIVKEEDRASLRRWQTDTNIAVHIWHAFYDEAFGIALDDAERLVGLGLIEPTPQILHAPSGASTRKTIYKVYYQHAYLVARVTEEPQPVAGCIEDPDGRVMPYVRFEGGRLRLSNEAVEVMRLAASYRRG